MYPFQRIMVGLDFTVMDTVLISYTAYLLRRLRPEKVYFLNIQEDLDVPDDIRDEFPMFDQPRDEKLLGEMKRKVAQYFPDWEAYDVELQVIEGSPQKEMVRWTHIKHIDLLILGNKNLRRGSGLIPQQLARKLTCSLLFVPEKASHQLRKVWVACDYSSFSKLAAEQGLELIKEEPHGSLHLQHIFTVPMGYYKTGKTEAQFVEIMRQHALKRYKSFVAELDLPPDGPDISPVCTYNATKKSPAAMVNERAHREEADLIIIGARGHSATTALLLGSFAEKVIKLDKDIPLLLAKHKDKSFSFFDMIDQL
jgi:nucleotide-binding universal stress UspA family protein